MVREQELCNADCDISAELFLDGGVTTALHLAVVSSDHKMVRDDKLRVGWLVGVP